MSKDFQRYHCGVVSRSSLLRCPDVSCQHRPTSSLFCTYMGFSLAAVDT